MGRTKIKTQRGKQEDNRERKNEGRGRIEPMGRQTWRERGDEIRTERPKMKCQFPQPSGPYLLPPHPTCASLANHKPRKFLHPPKGSPIPCLYWLVVNTGLLSLGPPANAEGRVWPHGSKHPDPPSPGPAFLRNLRSDSRSCEVRQSKAWVRQQPVLLIKTPWLGQISFPKMCAVAKDSKKQILETLLRAF